MLVEESVKLTSPGLKHHVTAAADIYTCT